MNEIGHLLFLDPTVDQLARLILGHGHPLLERHGTTELGPRWMLRCERHDGLDISTVSLSGFAGGALRNAPGSRDRRLLLYHRLRSSFAWKRWAAARSARVSAE